MKIANAKNICYFFYASSSTVNHFANKSVFSFLYLGFSKTLFILAFENNFFTKKIKYHAKTATFLEKPIFFRTFHAS